MAVFIAMMFVLPMLLFLFFLLLGKKEKKEGGKVALWPLSPQSGSADKCLCFVMSLSADQRWRRLLSAPPSNPPQGWCSGEDVVDEELREEQDTEDKPVAAR